MSPEPMSPEQEKLFGIDKLNILRSDIPAVTHVDYSARIQIVHAETNPRYHALLSFFKRRTGCSVLVNTRLQCARRTHCVHAGGRLSVLDGTEMESLVIGAFILRKDEQERSPAAAISLQR